MSLLLNPGAEACLRMLTPLTLLSRTGSDGDSDLPIKQCPMCGIYIERNQGCAQMLCKSCKHTFCWYCLQNLDVSVSPPPPNLPSPRLWTSRDGFDCWLLRDSSV